MSGCGHGAPQAPTLAASAVTTIPAMLGMFAGQRLRARVPPEAFRRVFFAGLLVLGLYLIAGHADFLGHAIWQNGSACGALLVDVRPATSTSIESLS